MPQSPGADLRAGSGGPRLGFPTRSLLVGSLLCRVWKDLEMENQELNLCRRFDWVNLGVLAGSAIGKVQQAIGYLSLRLGVDELGIS